ncbi:DNA/RNA polymerase [Mycena venus]|uniref:DNA/RNA polymerase n=1 Tax=Mycena venus TaxID=2733690 RepID=A0A8H6YK05_9AGAR|nr:DNA/RNA polymerase [Mycena venus]
MDTYQPDPQLIQASQRMGYVPRRSCSSDALYEVAELHARRGITLIHSPGPLAFLPPSASTPALRLNPLSIPPQLAPASTHTPGSPGLPLSSPETDASSHWSQDSSEDQNEARQRQIRFAPGSKTDASHAPRRSKPKAKVPPRPPRTLSIAYHPETVTYTYMFPPKGISARDLIALKLESFQQWRWRDQTVSAHIAANPSAVPVALPEFIWQSKTENVFEIQPPLRRCLQMKFTRRDDPAEWVYVMCQNDHTQQETWLKISAEWFYPSTMGIKFRRIQGKQNFHRTTALGTETDPPLPCAPLGAFQNEALVHTPPSLFRVSTPLNIPLLEQLLGLHPNQPLVESFCRGLRDGFWPWSRPVPSHPVTLDNSKAARSPAELSFLEETRDVEMAAGRFSAGFPALLPGMHAIPVHGVPKPRSEKLRLVTDFSFGEFSRNSTISRLDVNPTRMDSIRELGITFVYSAASSGQTRRSTFSSRTSRAHSKSCQCTSSGNLGKCTKSASSSTSIASPLSAAWHRPPIWTTFAGFVLWIAMVVFHILHLYAYMDDFFSVQAASDMAFYKPYNRYYPRNQFRLLLLWDTLGIPHEEVKQLFGQELVVIGFIVDSRRMCVSIPDDACAAFLTELREWMRNSKHGVRRSLRDWQALAGYANWAFNVFPLLKPALCNVYAKIGGKERPDALIWVNDAVCRDLRWLESHVANSDGILLIKSVDYHPDDANLVLYCDASTHGGGRGGMGFVIPSLGLGFQSPLPASIRAELKIFFYEALCVCSALHQAASLLPNGSRITIYTDSTNTVAIFGSLKALPAYNDILKSSVDVLIARDLDLRVLHVPGEHNSLADALSRWDNTAATSLFPGLLTQPFEPPRDALGAAAQ